MPVRYRHVLLRTAVKASSPSGDGAFGRPGRRRCPPVACRGRRELLPRLVV